MYFGTAQWVIYCPNGIVRYMSVAIRGVKRAQNFFDEEEF